jgi:hypothetical protein
MQRDLLRLLPDASYEMVRPDSLTTDIENMMVRLKKMVNGGRTTEIG